jgi:hypothetical protein
VIKNRLPILLAAVVVCSPALGQNPGEKPLTEKELLKQIESLNPAKPAATSVPAAVPHSNPAPNPLFNPAGAPGDTIKASPDKAGGGPNFIGTPGDKKAKPPTEITALEATFDNKANVAVFIGAVLVKDPQFNVDCDRLTAFLKHEDSEAKAAAPKPATAEGGTPAPAAGGKKQGSGLEKAIAVTTSDRRVKITQDKVESDGSITHGLGLADRAEYFATTGDIFLYGMPDVTQGMNRCIATAPETWMKLNRDGRMEAHGPHKTIIVDTSSERDNKNASQ